MILELDGGATPPLRGPLRALQGHAVAMEINVGGREENFNVCLQGLWKNKPTLWYVHEGCGLFTEDHFIYSDVDITKC